MRVVLLTLILLLALPADATEKPIPCITSAVFRLDHSIHGKEAAKLEELIRWAVRGGAKELVIDIDSDGGDAEEGIKIYRAIKASPIPTRCTVHGQAASAAALLLQACQIRVMTKDSRIAIHNPFTRLPISMMISVEQAKLISDELTTLANVYAGLTAARLHMPLEMFQSRISNGAMWILDANDALKAGAIDAVELE